MDLFTNLVASQFKHDLKDEDSFRYTNVNLLDDNSRQFKDSFIKGSSIRCCQSNRGICSYIFLCHSISKYIGIVEKMKIEF